MKYKVIQNTFPQHPRAPYAEPGDICHWELKAGFFNLINSHGKVVFQSPAVDQNGLRRSNGQAPVTCGIIAQVKSCGYVLEIGEIDEK